MTANAKPAGAQRMDEMWGEQKSGHRTLVAERDRLFSDGNYAMFIHWGLYSQLANRVDGKTFYGIGEWIMHPRMAGIPPERYKELARTFNPAKFDAKAIAALARDAGMKYVVITAKHHDGFALFDSKADDFNIVKATPWGKDPMHELAGACREAGLGFGFYYSHNQDWTFPGGNGGPSQDENGQPATFDDYVAKKCLPQIEELTTNYGPINLIWFDTPGRMPKQAVQQLIDVVRKNQPNALVSGRAGHGLGDYKTLGDMEVPVQNVPGMWESVDTTNDSWAYAWYDENWKSPLEILHRVIHCVGRGGTYMLNIGPRGDGSVPEPAVRALRRAGEWIHRHPQVVYGTEASPWGHALPWGEVTVADNTLFLILFKWPESGKLHLPGLKNEILRAGLLQGAKAKPVTYERSNGWTIFNLPAKAPDGLASVLEIKLDGPPEADPTQGLDPDMENMIDVSFAKTEHARTENQHWMEKFGEWKNAHVVTDWEETSRCSWDVEVLVPGFYHVGLTYKGETRMVWAVEVEGGQKIQNQQGAYDAFHTHPIGWLQFPKAGRFTVQVSCLEGYTAKSALTTIHVSRVEL